MTVNVSKPAINVREKLAELDKPTGIAGEAMLRAETPQEQFNLIGAGRRNLIINGDFQVSQRGDYSSATAVSDSNYYLDRWQVWSGVSATLTHISANQPNGGSLTKSAKVTATSSATSDLRLLQRVEFPSNYGGQTVTLSAWIKTNSPNCRMYFYNDAYLTSTETDPVTPDEEWHYVTLSIVVASGLSNFIPIIGIDGSTSSTVSISSGEYFEITGVQLELGKVATPFEHRSYGEELALCQRYYHQTGYRQYQRHGSGFAFSTTGASIVVNLPTTMRSIPALITSGASTLGLNYSSDTLNGLSSISVNTNGSSERLVTLTPIVAAGLTTGQAVLLINNNNSNAYIAFDAEL
jgi:hypothetical protein